MNPIISHLGLSALFAMAGLGVGWWLRNRSLGNAATTGPGNLNMVPELLSSLHNLSTRLVADVGHHNAKVREVDSQLACNDGNNNVDKLVDKLIKANQKVQQKLTQTEGRLEQLSTQIESHATEARTDPLTGLTNRRAFEEEAAERLQRFQQSEQTFTLMLLDIDHFKSVNDTYGHQAGDDVLRGFSQVLRENMRGRDIVSRFGGEEFTVLLPTTAIHEAMACAEGIRQTIAETAFETEDASLNVTISVGVAEVLPYEKMASLVKRADQAMYGAKNAGRNRAHWHDGTLVHPIRLPEPACVALAGEITSEANAPRLLREFDQPTTESSTTESSATCLPEQAKKEGKPIPTVEISGIESLNNLANKTMFCQELLRRIAEWNRGGLTFSTVLMQIDEYPELVRCYGESSMKDILGSIAKTLSLGIREMDLIARFDNSTFGLVFPKASLRNAICMVERLRKVIAQSGVEVDGRQIDITVSLGLAEVTDDDDMAAMVERSQAQLELAASNGGNRSSFATATASVG